MSQELYSRVLNLVKQNMYYPYEYMCHFKRFYEILYSKKEFCSSLSGEGISNKEYQHVLKVYNKFEIKMIKGLSRFCT